MAWNRKLKAGRRNSLSLMHNYALFVKLLRTSLSVLLTDSTKPLTSHVTYAYDEDDALIKFFPTIILSKTAEIPNQRRKMRLMRMMMALVSATRRSLLRSGYQLLMPLFHQFPSSFISVSSIPILLEDKLT
jgi:hypothetical protein